MTTPCWPVSSLRTPTRKCRRCRPLTSEPYGIGVNKEQKDLVRYVNRVIDTVKADGRWKTSYDTWFLPRLKVEAQPPQSVYGRS